MIPSKYCGNCGAVNDPTARFCGNCGARLNAPAPPTVPGAASSAAGSYGMRPAAPAALPPHAPGPPVTGAVAATPMTVTPAGGLQGTVVGRGRYAIDRFSENNRHLLVMEYISGENLEHKLEAHGPFDEETVRAWALELCSVLSYLHGRQPPVVFRDLKPGNIILQPDGRVRLIDFGIARLFKPQQKADTTALGTSGYASPEHYTGQTDARSDIYSLGAT
ncbi:MAG: inactive serine/threonine-protein kinase VRK3, partial [Chloroflexi bacterium]|nr:inactive serine/threonine-protein kinase VRK3 [Chloroflexota bacterium]